MNFEEVMKKAARIASEASNMAIKKYASGHVTDEDDITGILVGNLDTKLKDCEIDGIKWSSSILRHRKGVAAEEKEIGADILIHLKLDTPTHKYSKGVLIQAKRVPKDSMMKKSDHDKLRKQCEKMLMISPSSFVFNYDESGMRCGSALKIAGTTDTKLSSTCSWTSYRFFLEFFRCQVGDPSFKSALVKDIEVKNTLSFKATGEFKGMW